jgi:hypothetical protein
MNPARDRTNPDVEKASTDPEPAALSPRVFRLRFSKANLDYLPHAITVFGAIAFGGSSMFNSLIFSQWGLDFVQLATPADVLMSGMDAAGKLAAFVAAFLIPTVAQEIVRRRLGFAAMFKFSTWITNIVAIAALITMVTLIIKHPLIPTLIRMGVSSSIGFGIFLGVTWSMNYYDIFRDQFTRKWPKQSAGEAYYKLTGKRISYVSFVGVGVIYSIMFISFVVSDYVKNGFETKPTWAGAVPNNCEGRILWMGEKYIVIGCDESDPPHVILVGTQDRRGSIISTRNPKPAPVLAMRPLPPQTPVSRAK